MTSLSVAIITYNEEKNIFRCLDSVKNLADEIVIVDSFSTDKTKEISLLFGAKFIEHTFAGYIEQKNFALQQTSYDHVLLLDADEALSPALSNAVMNEKKNDFPSDAYTMNRCNNYCGKFIHHGLWYPDQKLRLLDKNKGHWGGINPHDKIEMNKKSSIKHLSGDILHFSYNSIEEHTAQNEKFSSISADSLYKQGKRSNFLKMIFSPAWAFFSGYFLKLGFLDGKYGWVIAKKTAELSFLKYKKLRQKQAGK